MQSTLKSAEEKVMQASGIGQTERRTSTCLKGNGLLLWEPVVLRACAASNEQWVQGEKKWLCNINKDIVRRLEDKKKSMQEPWSVAASISITANANIRPAELHRHF